MLYRILLLSLFSIALMGCSGGLESKSENTGTDSEDAVIRLTVGEEQESIAENSEIEIKAFVSGGTEPYTYAWTVVPVELEENVSGLEGDTVTFTAPDVATSQDVNFTVTVTDSAGNAAIKQKTITVEAVSSPPTALLTEANTERTDFEVNSGQSFSLHATWQDGQDAYAVKSAVITVKRSAGSEILGLPEDGLRRTFDTASITSMPQTELIASAEFVNTSSEPVTLEFELVVTDTSEIIVSSSVTVDILPEAESPPVVSAGSDQIVFEGQTVTLQGTSTTLAVAWLQSAGTPAVVIVGSDTENARFESPNVDVATVLEFQITGTNDKGQRSDEVKVTVLPFSAFDNVNDTGVMFCADGDDNFLGSCSLQTYPDQDAEFGRDIADLDKTGNGEAGFDFTLLDANGEEIGSGDPSCVRDNVTNLIWEVKETTGYRAYNSTFSWYDTETTTSGGLEGTVNGGSCTTQTGILTSCDTQSYVAAVNNVGLCGANDWRLPTVFELVSILNYSRMDDKFARLSDGTELWSQHADATALLWSSQPAMRDNLNAGDTFALVNAWAVSAVTGDESSNVKSTGNRVLLVRGGN